MQLSHRIVVGLAALAIVASGVIALRAKLNRRIECMQCHSNLHALYSALHAYSQSNGGRNPRSMVDMVSGGFLDQFLEAPSNPFRCDAAPQWEDPTWPPTSRDAWVRRLRDGEPIWYALASPGAPLFSAGDGWLVVQVPVVHSGGFYIVTDEGEVQFVNTKE